MNEIYQLEEFNLTEGGITARVRIDPSHDIFRGHFPGQPVMPGVCMMELICAVAGKKAGKTLRISGGPVIKFLNMVDPGRTSELFTEMTLAEKAGQWFAAGRLFKEEITFVRFQLTMIALPQ